MIPLKNEAAAEDLEGLKRAEQTLSEILHEKGGLLKESREIWKSLITLRTWLKKALGRDSSALLQIKCYGGKLLCDMANETQALARDEQRIEEESPAAEKMVITKSTQYFEAYNELIMLHDFMKKRALLSEFESIPIAV